MNVRTHVHISKSGAFNRKFHTPGAPAGVRATYSIAMHLNLEPRMDEKQAIDRLLALDPEGLAWLAPEHLTQERIRSSFIIDLRMKYERAMSPGIPAAKLWSNIGFEKHFKEIPHDKEVILMCSTGIFSFEAGYRLAMAGHPKVRVVSGGYEAWKALHPELLNCLRSRKQ